MARKPTARRIARLTTAALTAALALPGAALAQSGSQGPLDAGLLAFSGSDGRVESIYPNGHARGQLFNTPAGVVGAWDAQGRRLAITAKDGVTLQDYDAHQGTQRDITNPQNAPIRFGAYDPATSRVAYGSPGGLYAFDPFGSTTELLVDAAVNRVGWSSHDATGTLVYDDDFSGVIRARQGYGDWLLVPEGANLNPSIAQNGSIVAFESVRDGSDHDIRVIAADASGYEEDLSTELPGMTAADETLPAVSPDGTKVAYVAPGTDGAPAIWIAPVNGSTTPAKVPGSETAGGITGLAWQPTSAPTTSAPSISGTAAIGSQVTVGFGSFSAPWPGGVETGVQRCPADGPLSDCTTVASSTTQYMVKATDAGFRLRSYQRAFNPAGDAVAYSAPTAVVPVPDTTPPAEPTLFGHPPAVSHSSDADFGFSGENGATFACSLDGSALATCASIKGYTGLPDGEHTFSVRQTDAAGNTGAPKAFTWTIDTTPPAAPALTRHPAKLTNAATAELAVSGLEDAALECRVDGEPYDGPCPSPLVLEDLADGEHTFEVRQVASWGGVSAWTAYAWIVDTTAPAAPAVTSAPATSTATSATVAYTAEPHALVEYALDGGAWAKAGSPLKLDGLKVGDHALRLRQTDAAGNTGPATTVTWTVKAAAVQTETPKSDPQPEQQPAPPAPPAAPAPAATPRALTAVLGGATTGSAKPGGTASAATIKVEDQAVGVGCQITGTVLTACKVDLYADVATGARARAAAARKVLVGTGTYADADGTGRMAVKVKLNATGRALLERSPDGLRVSVDITGTPVSGAKLRATGVATLVAPRAAAVVGGFAVDSAKLTPAAKRTLRRLAARFDDARVARVRCVGHTDGSSDDIRYLDALGRRRAVAVCRFLAARGVDAKVRTTGSRGATRPAATNRTAAGRAQNRRVELRIER